MGRRKKNTYQPPSVLPVSETEFLTNTAHIKGYKLSISEQPFLKCYVNDRLAFTCWFKDIAIKIAQKLANEVILDKKAQESTHYSKTLKVLAKELPDFFEYKETLAPQKTSYTTRTRRLKKK